MHPVTAFLIGIFLTTLFWLGFYFFSNKTIIPAGHVTVEVDIATDRPVAILSLSSNNSSAESTEQIIRSVSAMNTLFVFHNPGEGEYKLCCTYGDGDQETVCTCNYVEGGYHQKVKVRDDALDITYH